MAGKKVGSDGQVRKTTAEWAADTATYPEGMRLMDTTDGSVRVSKGATYALAWTQAPGGPVGFGDLTGTPQDNTSLAQQLETLANGIGAKADAIPTYRAILNQSGTSAPVASDEYNTTEITPSYGYASPGNYTISMVGLPVGGVRVLITNGNGACFFTCYYTGDGETIELATLNTSNVAVNGILANASIQITIDPTT